MTTHFRGQRLVRPLVFGLALSIAPIATAAASPASATVCESPWGSLAKYRAPSTDRQITNVRSGRHACFDRLVIALNDDGRGKPGYELRYVRHVVKDGSGDRVPLRGRADVFIVIHAPTSDADGDPTYEPADQRELVDVDGYQTFRQVAFGGSFEGWTTIGLGVRARLPMRVFVLKDSDGGRRVVVDVAHDW
jgi:hypothetical protein